MVEQLSGVVTRIRVGPTVPGGAVQIIEPSESKDIEAVAPPTLTTVPGENPDPLIKI